MQCSTVYVAPLQKSACTAWTLRDRTTPLAPATLLKQLCDNAVEHCCSLCRSPARNQLAPRRSTAFFWGLFWNEILGRRSEDVVSDAHSIGRPALRRRSLVTSACPSLSLIIHFPSLRRIQRIQKRLLPEKDCHSLLGFSALPARATSGSQRSGAAATVDGPHTGTA